MAQQILFLIFFTVGCICAKSIPSFITLCHRNDPNLNKCVFKGLQDTQKHLKKGIPEFQLPDMTPLIISEIFLNGGVNFKASFKNVEIYDADKFSVINTNWDLDKAHFDMDIFLEHVRIKSKFNVNGKLLFFNLNGEGPADGNITNVKLHAALDGHHNIKNGKDFLNFTDMTLDMKFENANLYFEKIFGDNEELNVHTNKVINENIKDIANELKPSINAAVKETILQYLSRVFSRFSVDELFPK